MFECEPFAGHYVISGLILFYVSIVSCFHLFDVIILQFRFLFICGTIHRVLVLEVGCVIRDSSVFNICILAYQYQNVVNLYITINGL